MSDDKKEELFDTSVTFADLGLSEAVVEGLTATGFVHPTGIQAAMIPAVMNGKDVIGQAKTGTGKTAAFGLPILSICDPDTRGQALVLTPTRELAAQVAGELDELGRATNIRTSVIIGGESMRNQQKSLDKGGHLIVGTPGRVMDLHARGQLSFNDIKFIVLDEVDRMLDIGFREDIRKFFEGAEYAAVVARFYDEQRFVLCVDTPAPQVPIGLFRRESAPPMYAGEAATLIVSSPNPEVGERLGRAASERLPMNDREEEESLAAVRAASAAGAAAPAPRHDEDGDEEMEDAAE